MTDLLRELREMVADVPQGRCPLHHQPCGRRVLYATTDGAALLLDGTLLHEPDIEQEVQCACGEPVRWDNVLAYYAWWWLQNEPMLLIRLDRLTDHDDIARNQAEIELLRTIARDHLVAIAWQVARVKGEAKRQQLALEAAATKPASKKRRGAT